MIEFYVHFMFERLKSFMIEIWSVGMIIMQNIMYT